MIINKLKEFQSLANDVCHARRCIGRKWSMDQMCSKCEIHCFSHELWKISELGKISKLQKISEKSFLSKFVSLKNFSLLSGPLHCIKVICTEKLSEKIQNGQKWLFQFFFDNLPQKDWYKFGMAKNGHSKFFLKIFPKKTGIKLEIQQTFFMAYLA